MSTIFDMELNDIEIDDGSSTMINTPNNRNIEIDYDVLSEDEPIEVDNEIEIDNFEQSAEELIKLLSFKKIVKVKLIQIGTTISMSFNTLKCIKF
ncbi:hypothetical protein BLOT_003880 [Blomia tropicalis]|nr:hypothetical protein BLOT_003880 [Blomia tropicalis]